MKTILMRTLSGSLAAVLLLGILSGCRPPEPVVAEPTVTTTEPTVTTTEPTVTTTEATDPIPVETTAAPEITEPSTEPTAQACAHRWSDWKTTAPTCAKDGTKERSCTDCGETETQRLSALEHSYGSWTVTKAETCSANGSRERKCSACGKVQTEVILSAAHSYGPWSTTKEPTCSGKGAKEHQCSACGKVQTESIPALAHSYSSWSTTQKAACEAKGQSSRSCAVCGKTETRSIDATGHSWDNGKVTAESDSCSANGTKTYTCTQCGKTRSESITGNHSFGQWQYEDYTYKQDGVDRPSHRKVRICTKCGYKEKGNTPDHYCARGADNHKVTTVKEGTCTTKATMRSTCKICGWYVEYEGRKAPCNWVDEEVHLSDYGAYTNELDAVVSECLDCGERSIWYKKGKGWEDNNRYRFNLTVNQGNAANAQTPVTDNFDYYDNPKQQTVKRDFKYDSDGYVKQFTVYWWYNGDRYSQVIKCGKGELETWFAEYGLEAGEGYKHSIRISGTKIVPYKISWTG